MDVGSVFFGLCYATLVACVVAALWLRQQRRELQRDVREARRARELFESRCAELLTRLRGEERPS